MQRCIPVVNLWWCMSIVWDPLAHGSLSDVGSQLKMGVNGAYGPTQSQLNPIQPIHMVASAPYAHLNGPILMSF